VGATPENCRDFSAFPPNNSRPKWFNVEQRFGTPTTEYPCLQLQDLDILTDKAKSMHCTIAQEASVALGPKTSPSDSDQERHEVRERFTKATSMVKGEYAVLSPAGHTHSQALRGIARYVSLPHPCRLLNRLGLIFVGCMLPKMLCKFHGCLPQSSRPKRFNVGKATG
jgi:hypothetical protein